MTGPSIIRDERTVAIENASYRWGYAFLTYGLLLVVIGRAIAYRESNWDLMALVIAGGLLTSLYQAVRRALPRRWARTVLAAMFAAAAIAAGTAYFVAPYFAK